MIKDSEFKTMEYVKTIKGDAETLQKVGIIKVF